MKKGKYLDEKFGVTSAPVSKKISEAIEKGEINLDSEQDLDEFIKELQNIQERELGKTASLNLLNINNGKNTIEFRVGNGSLNPDVWIENIKLFSRIVQVSEKLAQIEKKPIEELSEDDKNLMNLMNDLKKEIPENEKMETLLQMLFTEEERPVYREKYEENSRLLEKASRNNNNPIESLEFAELLEFKKNRHNISELRDVAIGSKEGNYQSIIAETRKGITEEKIREEGNNIQEREE